MKFRPRSFLEQLNATDLSEYYVKHPEPKLLDIESVPQETTLYDITKIIPKKPAGKDYIESLEIVLEMSFLADGELFGKYKFLGTQTLQDVISGLICMANYTILEHEGNLSEYIVIDNRVYTDQESTLKKFKEWERNQSRIGQAAELEYFSMDTKLLDLSVRLDESYVLVHQGSCKHTFQINQVRLLRPFVDPKYIQDYPSAIFQEKLLRPTCAACRYGDPKFSVFNSAECYDGCMWCHRCFNKVFVTDGKVDESIKYTRMTITI
ncbi:small nuclear RNA activating complex, polypeptide 3 [Terramyces sp. JEL0728]|nr:small nuclear RNA activating complex, polypeptide 3 [Terramyces sp. JEL0728]